MWKYHFFQTSGDIEIMSAVEENVASHARGSNFCFFVFKLVLSYRVTIHRAKIMYNNYPVKTRKA